MLDGEEVSRILDILGNRNRRRIIQLLRQKPCFVTEISERLMISPKAVIEHLQMMEREQILLSRNDDRRRKYYYLSQDINVMIKLHREDTAPSVPGVDSRTQFFNSLKILRKMMESRVNLLNNLEYLDRDIDHTLRELMHYGKDIIASEEEMNLVLTL